MKNVRCPKCKGYGNETHWKNSVLIIEVNHTCDLCLGKGYVPFDMAKGYVGSIKTIKEVLQESNE